MDESKRIIIEAAKNGTGLEELLNENSSISDVNFTDDQGNSPLHYATIARSRKCCITLLEKSANCNLKNNSNQSPLHIACLNGDEGIISNFTKHNADFEMADNNGNTAILCLALANKSKAATVVGTLINRGANAHVVNNDGQNALHLASKGGNVDLCRILVHTGVDSKLKDKFGFTPLDYAESHDIKKIL
eukprot:TRINITY_DN1872_c0_g1_i1.p2 TRINITY_DN1872_c0_g1~~TRINITY_DN1872_c0_g1_i1.p2  ORF type:complete len:190 (-),score=29.34 TRINITY_DN1872_c0_g1_i1:99-668(-)